MTHPSIAADRRMPLAAALEALVAVRTDEIVVTTMGSAREWPKLSKHPLDFQYLPSAMGHAPMIALGLALAQPKRRVLCFTGDGGLLMSLGCLVTVAAARATNLTVVVLDNSLYEVTGGQATAGTACDFAGIARSSGFATAERYEELAAWKSAVAGLWQKPGPRFVQLRVESVAKPPKRLNV